MRGLWRVAGAPLWFLTALLAAGSALGQGTRADYERANSLNARWGAVAPRAPRPTWLEGGRLVYREELPRGERRFWWVDPRAKRREAAFNHERVAAALSRLLGREVAAGKIPVDQMREAREPGNLLVQVGTRTFRVNRETGEVEPSQEPPVTLPALVPGGLRSRDGGPESSMELVNRTEANVELFWVTSDGERRSYGRIAPGQSRSQHTFAGHLFLVVRDGKDLCGFRATVEPGLAVITNDPPRATESGRRAAPARTEEPGRSPDGKWRVVVEQANLRLVEVGTGTSTPITTDGVPGNAYGGPIYWAPDSRRFLVMKTEPEESRPLNLIYSAPRDQLQPKLAPRQYLKPGDRISHPRPHLVVLQSEGPPRLVKPAEELFPNPWSFTEISWQSDSRRVSFLYNQRGHQVARLIGLDGETGEVSTLIEERSDTFIDWTNKLWLHRLKGDRAALWMSERSGWNHLYWCELDGKQSPRPVTLGNWVVRGVDLVDEERKEIWFRASGLRAEEDPYHLHHCRVNFDGTGFVRLTDGDGTHQVEFSPDRRFLMDTYSRVDLPPTTEIRDARTGERLVALGEANSQALREAGWSPTERFVAPGRDGVTPIYGIIHRPTRWDPAARYPVVEAIYAGPHGAHVPKEFAPAPGARQMAELGFVVVQIDGMGTNHRGKKFHDVCWKNLADAGFPDRIAWIRAAAARYPQLDLTRVGIYGTSAGGQNALGGLLTHPEFYKVGVADCGCHDNRMDKIWWNEQWMGWPLGPHYAEQSNTTLAPKLQGKLLLMVGEADTNVDPASTLQVVDALIRADKDFDLVVAPNVGHGVVGTAYGRRRLQDFLVTHLLGVTPRAR